jgi:hypothetical protein
MAIPDLPVFFDMRYSDDSGKLTSDAFLYNDNLWQSLNLAIFLLNSIVLSTVNADGSIVNDGLVFPSKTNAEILDYISDPDIPNGAAWYDLSDNKIKVKSNGMLKVIQYEP